MLILSRPLPQVNLRLSGNLQASWRIQSRSAEVRPDEDLQNLVGALHLPERAGMKARHPAASCAKGLRPRIDLAARTGRAWRQDRKANSKGVRARQGTLKD
jgi:hypothetical protein